MVMDANGNLIDHVDYNDEEDEGDEFDDVDEPAASPSPKAANAEDGGSDGGLVEAVNIKAGDLHGDVSSQIEDEDERKAHDEQGSGEFDEAGNEQEHDWQWIFL